MKRLGQEQRSLLEAATLRYQRALEEEVSPFSTSAREYLAERWFDHRARARYRLGYVADPLPGHEPMAGRVSIPYLTPHGVVALKFRCVADHNCKEAKCPKYMATPGSGARLYNARAILVRADTIAVCEGEFDAMAISMFAGVPTVGYPGADTWKQKATRHWPRVFAGLDVVVVADGDRPGRDAALAVAESLDSARVVHMPDGEDGNSMIIKDGPEAFRARLGLEE